MTLFEALQNAKPVYDDPNYPKPYPDPDYEDPETQMATPKPIPNLSQYAMYGDSYVPVSRTAPNLPPGIYDVGLNPLSGQAHFAPKRVKTDNLIVVPDMATAAIIRELDRFWALRASFKKYGLTHKRGVLMYGPPGSGKTSTLAQVGQSLIDSGGVMFYGDPGAMTSCLSQFRATEPERPVVVVFEDLDNYLMRRGDSDLLPLLDGENSVDGVVFVATTNHLMSLPPRIRCRPSRFDQVLEVGMPSAAARRAYISSRGFPAAEVVLEAIVQATEGMTLAHVKEAAVSVLVLGNDFAQTMTRLAGMSSPVVEQDE